MAEFVTDILVAALGEILTTEEIEKVRNDPNYQRANDAQRKKMIGAVETAGGLTAGVIGLFAGFLLS